MTTTAEEYWDKFYTENDLVKRDPTPFLQKMIRRLQKGKVLDVAMGEGRNAVFLAKNGFAEVKGFDISSVAIEHARALAEENGVKIEANRTNLDLFIMGIMEYDSIVMTNFRPSTPRYYSEMIRALKQGGTVLIESFTTEELREAIPEQESYRDYFFQSNEILQHLKGLRILSYNEDIVNGRHVVQCLAQKPYDKDAVKYNLFGMSTKDADKGPSKHKQLAEALFKKQ